MREPAGLGAGGSDRGALGIRRCEGAAGCRKELRAATVPSLAAEALGYKKHVFAMQQMSVTNQIKNHLALLHHVVLVIALCFIVC